MCGLCFPSFQNQFHQIVNYPCKDEKHSREEVDVSISDILVCVMGSVWDIQDDTG